MKKLILALILLTGLQAQAVLDFSYRDTIINSGIGLAPTALEFDNADLFVKTNLLTSATFKGTIQTV